MESMAGQVKATGYEGASRETKQIICASVRREVQCSMYWIKSPRLQLLGSSIGW